MSDSKSDEDVIEITDLSHDARGVGHLPASACSPTKRRVVSGLRGKNAVRGGKGSDQSDGKGKACFISGALPGEIVRWRVTESKGSFNQGEVVEVLKASPHRVTPPCEYYHLCGGCELQHLSAEAQSQEKESQLRNMLSRAGIEAESWLPPLLGSQWGYRRRARLAVAYENGRVLLGYRKKAGKEVVDIDHCMTLAPILNQHIPRLKHLVDRFKKAGLTELDLLSGERESALCLNLAKKPSDAAIQPLKEYCDRESLQLWIRASGENAIRVRSTETSTGLMVKVEEGLEIQVRPGQFVQVNAEANRMMVSLAMDLLDTEAHYRVLDLFCGAGNFSLPAAHRVREVVGIEGSPDLVLQAQENAAQADVANAYFRTQDLFNEKALSGKEFSKGSFDRILLDPPRAGAKTLMPALSRLAAQKVVYVSCHPATLVRDTKALISGGYRLRKIAAVDMFPHTRHLESIALFELDR